MDVLVDCCWVLCSDVTHLVMIHVSLFLTYHPPPTHLQDCVVLFGTIEEAIVFVDEEVFPETPPVGDVKTRARLLQLALSLEFAEIESWHRCALFLCV